ncbi:MAG TPA: tetratricopeptide repeat protein [Acidisarcina sp.]|nr:tetratricopeptide repeat protein [Acidisarcina sp.]
MGLRRCVKFVFLGAILAFAAVPGQCRSAGQGPTAALSTRYQQLKEASRLIAAGQLAAADSLLLRILRDYPNEARAIDLQGVIRAEQGDLSQAEERFRRAIEIDPTIAAAHGNLAHLLHTEHRDQAAMEEYEAALTQEPANTAAKAGLVEIAEQQSLAARKAGDNHQALAVLIEAKKYAPHEPRILFDFGLMALETGFNRDAEAALREAHTLEPENLNYLYGLARAEIELQQMPEAERLMRQYLSRMPDDATAHYGLGRVLQMLERNAEAKPEFTRSIALQPEQTEAYFQLGQIDLDEANFASATQYFEKALSFNPKHAGALTSLGIVAYRQKDYAKAEKYLKPAVEAAPTYQLAHYYYGLALGKLGEKEASEKELSISSRLIEEEHAQKKSYLQLQTAP